jgi:hypothetical protein
MTSISDSSHLLPTPTSTSTSSIVNIPSTHPLAVCYDMCIHRPSDPRRDVFYAPRNSSTSRSWAQVAFSHMEVCAMLEPEIPVEFATTNTYRLPKPPSKYESWGVVEWDKWRADALEKSSKCKVCGVKLWEYLEEWYTWKGDYEWEIMYDPCECEAKCAYVYPEAFSTVRSAKHPTGRSIKRSAKCRTKRDAEQSAKQSARRAIKC